MVYKAVYRICIGIVCDITDYEFIHTSGGFVYDALSLSGTESWTVQLEKEGIRSETFKEKALLIGLLKYLIIIFTKRDQMTIDLFRKRPCAYVRSNLKRSYRDVLYNILICIRHEGILSKEIRQISSLYAYCNK